MAASLESLSRDLLCLSARIHVRRIKHGDAGVETDIDETRRQRHFATTKRLEELVATAERGGTKTEDRDFQSRTTKLPIFHSSSRWITANRESTSEDISSNRARVR
jgi:hypothetical protein